MLSVRHSRCERTPIMHIATRKWRLLVTVLLTGVLLMVLLGQGGVLPGAIFGAGGALIGGIAGERVHAIVHRK